MIASAPPTVPDSVLRTTVTADLAPLRALLRTTLPVPLSRGVDRIRIPILTEITRPIDVIRKNLPSVPPDAGCLKTPLGRVPPKIVGEVTRVIEHGLEAANRVVRAQLPTDVVVTHRVDLVDVDLTMNGAAVTIGVAADLTVNVVANTPVSSVGVLQCGNNQPRPRVKLSITGALVIAPAGALRFRRSGASLTWVRPCELSAIKLSVEELARLPVLHDVIERQVDAALARRDLSYSFAEKLAELGRLMEQPIPIAGRAWLAISPRAIDVVRVTGTATTAAIDVSIAFQAGLRVGARPAPAAHRPLEPGPISTVDGFRVHLLASIPYREVERHLEQRWLGEQTVAGRTLLVRRIRIYGAGEGRVVAVIELSQPVEGKLYLVGKPWFDPRGGTIAIRDLEYVLEANSLLARAMDYLRHGQVQRMIAGAAVFPLDGWQAEARAWLEQRSLATSPLALTVDAREVTIDSLVAGNDALHVVGTATGSVTARAAL